MAPPTPVRDAVSAALGSEGTVADGAQLAALAKLDALAVVLAPGALPLAARIRDLLDGPGRHPPQRGLYLHGAVGRGKTMLMDAFFAALDEPRKRRCHFHRFMRELHAELAHLAQVRDPLAAVAARIARRTRVLCFDELAVIDIGDAMLLGPLLTALCERGVVLVATSNVPPAELYRDGLQRSRFLPAIAALERYCEVVAVDGGVDYRLRALERAELYHSPLDPAADASLERSFARLAGSGCSEPLEIDGRHLAVRRRADGVAWFEFAELCEGPRSAGDYIELACEHHTLLISGIPRLDASRDDAARRMISLIDELYDRNVKLIASAEVPIAALYAGQRLAFEFQRTASRLVEMQSHEYLARPHRP
jgi:cell division protein ZapE